ncbi:Elongin-C [Caenorhabditis elegans]|uniref:Elongin-C n=1 Tax=Caenorhabditis elegans TaxID=6239 RepID=Q23153_CAEEL|nr:Elongin-C [Caenorhabditis elegans]CCD70299.2 Elongin-C [Caenorhabditis elegans]
MDKNGSAAGGFQAASNKDDGLEEPDSQKTGAKPQPVPISGLEGPRSKYVKLVSNDDHEFIIKREVAMTSKSLRELFANPTVDLAAANNTVYFSDFQSHILQKVCHYLAYKTKYRHSRVAPPFDIPPDIAMDLLAAANELEC